MPDYLSPALSNRSNLTPGQGLATDIAGIIGLIQSLGNTDKNNASQGAHIADPFMDQRPQYQAQMQQFMSDQSAIFQDPAFQAAQRVGGEAVARNAGAAGMGNSGNKFADLFSFGQSNALAFEKQKYSELLPLTGATTGNPGAAALATQLGQQNKQKGISSGIAGIVDALIASGIPAALAKQIGQMFGGGSGLGGPGGAAGGNIPAGTPDASGNISNGDGTFNSPSGQIVDANGQPIDLFGGGQNMPNITDPTTGYPMPITGGQGPDLSIPGVSDPFGGGSFTTDTPIDWTSPWGGGP